VDSPNFFRPPAAEFKDQSTRSQKIQGFLPAAGRLTAEEKKKGMTRAKKAVQEVILPKIPLGEERTYLQSLIAEL